MLIEVYLDSIEVTSKVKTGWLKPQLQFDYFLE